MPKRSNIIRSMNWLVRDTKPGDIFFFHYSGHGAQQDPINLEEDEVQRSGQVTDDVIHETLVDPLPNGARLTSVMDCSAIIAVIREQVRYGSTMGVAQRQKLTEDVNPWLSREDSDIDEVRFLSPSSSDNEIEAALYKYHGNKDLAVNELLNNADLKIPARSMPDQMYAPTASGAYGVESQHNSQPVRAQVECGMCHEVMIVQMEATGGAPVRARATCPRCHQINEFDIPASQQQVSSAPVVQQPQVQAFAPSVAYPASQVNSAVQAQPTMESQAQYGMPATMQVQQATVGTPPPTLSGVQRALLIGINYYGSSCELSGCIPDVHNMKRLLIETYHWNPNDIKLLTDDGQNEMPTRANIMSSMKWLVRDAKPGDIFFFHYSGHGAQQEDPLHLEEDGMNETIIPVDVKKAGQITDDEIFQSLVVPLPSGVRLTSVMDCCHSGTGMDLPWKWVEHRGWKEDVNPWHSTGDVQLFSGCDDAQTSADSSAGPISGGAMTTAFCNAIRARPQISYVDLIDSLNDEMRRKHMSQRPQLSSSQVFPLDRPFNLTDILPNQNKHIGRTVNHKFKARPDPKKNDFLKKMMVAGGVGLVGGMLLGAATDDSPRPIVFAPRPPPLFGGPRIVLGGGGPFRRGPFGKGNGIW